MSIGMHLVWQRKYYKVPKTTANRATASDIVMLDGTLSEEVAPPVAVVFPFPFPELPVPELELLDTIFMTACCKSAGTVVAWTIWV